MISGISGKKNKKLQFVVVHLCMCVFLLQFVVWLPLNLGKCRLYAFAIGSHSHLDYRKSDVCVLFSSHSFEELSLV